MTFNFCPVVRSRRAVNITVCDYEQECRSSKDGRTLECLSPNVADLDLVVTPKDPYPVLAILVMDGVKQDQMFEPDAGYLRRFQYYPDPVFLPLSPVEGNATENVTYLLSYQAEQLTIYGENLLAAGDFSAIVVDLGLNDTCAVVGLSATSVTCVLPVDRETDEPYTVTVSVGNIDTVVGNLVLSSQLTTPTSTLAPPTTNALIERSSGDVALYVLGTLLALAVPVIAIFLIMRKRRIGPFRKETNARVFYTPHPGASQPYDTAPGEAAAILDLDDELRFMLETADVLIAREKLILGEVLGSGHFGCVYKGHFVKDKMDIIDVAIKTLNRVQDQDTRAFFKEGLIMKDFKHENVVPLIGICLPSGTDGPMVVLPYMQNGDLLSYIRDENNTPTVRILLRFSLQIADGMKYLSELKFVHRDLAARNCMLDDKLVAKVADFGLSRDVYEENLYTCKDHKAKLPIKWMPIESLEKGTYSLKSDVWSYGVVMWELMTRGVTPYPDVDSWDIVTYLRIGRRLPKPTYCPDDLYAIMLQCWCLSAIDRPTFAQLSESLADLLARFQRLDSASQPLTLDVTYENVPSGHAAAAGAAAVADPECSTLPRSHTVSENASQAQKKLPTSSARPRHLSLPVGVSEDVATHIPGEGAEVAVPPTPPISPVGHAPDLGSSKHNLYTQEPHHSLLPDGIGFPNISAEDAQAAPPATDHAYSNVPKPLPRSTSIHQQQLQEEPKKEEEEEEE
ncbi:PREDICTED: hepatocyte growth factor receptor-like [Priapulus caudatus]|uniref:receptor protein-tyrosine kinase n=1 Tax=Priapulus caudatus TaxID=37621 RepID=A0ABM1F2R0_PRICU|nr:PREDICTED: hepatocyte growth factor receptor-like [Priapulus caudatus]